MIKITDEMKDRINKAFDEKKYCGWATTSGESHPDLSFRGSTLFSTQDRSRILGLPDHSLPGVPAQLTLTLAGNIVRLL